MATELSPEEQEALRGSERRKGFGVRRDDLLDSSKSTLAEVQPRAYGNERTGAETTGARDCRGCAAIFLLNLRAPPYCV